MLYFIKRNHKLQEYKDYYKDLLSLCNSLDKLNPELEKGKKILLRKPQPTLPSVGEYLNQKHSFAIDDFNELDLTVRDSFKSLKKYVSDFKLILDNLKKYESFQGRIKFGQFANIFNFEDYIYEDKQFQYSIISNYNKRIIPEFVSATFSNMVYENFVGDEIRRNMEQYLIAIMSNMDYQNFAHIGQLKQELSEVLNKENNLIYIIGAAPQTFTDEEYVELLNERITRADSLLNDGIEFRSKTKLWKRHKLDNSVSKKIIDSTLYSTSDEESVLGKNKMNGEKPTSKLTSANLDYIYKDIISKEVKNYNLFIVTSTFHVLKTAIEFERHFYNVENHKPDNIIFIGDEKFFDLAHNKVNCRNKDKATYHKKKIKSFLYELFMHTLDKNAVK